MSNVYVRDAEESDLSAIIDIYNQAIASRMITLGTTPLTVPGRLEWFHQHTENRPLWVAVREEDSQVIGWLNFEQFHARAAYHITSEVNVYITRECQRQGYGTQLLRRAVERAPSLGARRLVGLIMATNTAALRFFGKAGFQEWARLPHVMELDGIERDLMIMGRKAG